MNGDKRIRATDRPLTESELFAAYALAHPCPATAAAPVRHFVQFDTFGHVCELPADHDGRHRCACGHGWT